jgi:hypothetical protein
VNTCNDKDWSLLNIAVQEGAVDIVERLLAQVNANDAEGRRPLDRKGKEEDKYSRR